MILELQLLERQSQRAFTPAQRESVASVVGQAKQLGEAMQRMLEGALDRRALSDLHLEQGSLADAVAEVVQRRHYHGRQVLLADGGDTEGWFDRSRMQQVVENLLDNAAKFSPGASPVDIEVRGEGDHVLLRVVDRGVGIAPEELPFIFERYRRSGAARESGIPGMGLGLHICRSIVEAHGGEIWADSAPDWGTAMNVLLPREARNHAPHSGSGRRPCDSEGRGPGAGGGGVRCGVGA